MANNWAVVNNEIFYDSRFSNLPPYVSMLYHFLLYGTPMTRCGIVRIHSGAMEMPIFNDIIFHCNDGWEQFRKDIPEAKDLNFSNLASRIYPFIEVLELRGLIEYDKPKHLLRIVDFHKHCKIDLRFGDVRILEQLKGVYEKFDGHEFFDRYLQENQEIYTKLLDATRKRYAEKLVLDSQRGLYQTKEEKETEEYKKIFKAYEAVRNARDPDAEVPEMCCKIDLLSAPKSIPTSCKILNLQDSVQTQKGRGSR